MDERLTRGDERRVRSLAKQVFEDEIDRFCKSRDFKKKVSEIVEKALKDRATKDEIVSVTKGVLKNFYRELSVNYPALINRIQV
jgi:hypothetical protein